MKALPPSLTRPKAEQQQDNNRIRLLLQQWMTVEVNVNYDHPTLQCIRLCWRAKDDWLLLCLLQQQQHYRQLMEVAGSAWSLTLGIGQIGERTPSVSSYFLQLFGFRILQNVLPFFVTKTEHNSGYDHSALAFLHVSCNRSRPIPAMAHLILKIWANLQQFETYLQKQI